MKTIPKIVENNENSHVKNVVSPANNVEKKKNTLQRFALGTFFFSKEEKVIVTRKSFPFSLFFHLNEQI